MARFFSLPCPSNKPMRQGFNPQNKTGEAGVSIPHFTDEKTKVFRGKGSSCIIAALKNTGWLLGLARRLE